MSTARSDVVDDAAVVMSIERKHKTDKEIAAEFDSHIKGIVSHHIYA